MRRNSQDRMSNDPDNNNNNNNNTNNDNDDDDTPSKLRRSPPSSINHRSRYEVDHGSCDWIATNGSINSTIAATAATAAQSHIHQRNGIINHNPISTNLVTSNNNNNNNNASKHGGSNSIDNYGIDIPLAGSPQQSPTMEGLHHRTRKKLVPTQQLSSSQATSSSSSSSSHDHRQPYPHRTQRRSYNHNRNGGELALWKRAVQLFVASILFGYCFFLYLAQNKNWGKEQQHFGNRPESHLLVKRESHRRPSSSLGKGGKIHSDGRANDSGKKSKHGLDGRGRDSKSKKYGEDWKESDRIVAKAETSRNGRVQNPSDSTLRGDYSFHAIELQQTYKEPIIPAYQRALMFGSFVRL